MLSSSNCTDCRLSFYCCCDCTRSLKEIKPRVDTHWKKDTNLIAAKPLTRTDSIKLGGLAAASRSALSAVNAGQAKLVRTRTLQTARPEVAQRVGVPRQRSDETKSLATTMAATAAAAAIAARSTTTAKMRVAKDVTSAAVAAAAAAAVEQRPTTAAQQVRRQESNLTRRSLTKLRAAIQKDKQQKLHSGGESTSSVSSSLESLADAKVSDGVQLAEPQKGHSTISIVDVSSGRCG